LCGEMARSFSSKTRLELVSSRATRLLVSL
jgi:hypothetical protein